MILEKGDMWSVFGKTDLWLFTGNSYVNKRKELVMGRGLAAQVKEKYPRLPYHIGISILAQYWPGGHLGIYGLDIHHFNHNFLQSEFGVFQVKRHFKEKASLSLIGYSCIELWKLINNPSYSGTFLPKDLQRIDMNFPGIGYGGLLRRRVLPQTARQTY